MDIRILKYILRECRNAIQRTTKNAFAIATKVAFGTAFEIVTIVALSVGFCIGFTSCHTTKHIAQTEAQSEGKTAEPQWHTCLMQNAQAVVTLGEETMRANCTLQTVRDSMLIISIMPMLGIEMLRIEATPTQITGIDKPLLQANYRQATKKPSWAIRQANRRLCCVLSIRSGSWMYPYAPKPPTSHATNK